MNNGNIVANKVSYSCITCNQIFSDFHEQRAHFQTAYHRENCRRKTVNLPPMTTSEYVDFLQDHAKKQQERLNETQKNAKTRVKERIMCELCQKIFSSENAYKNHAASEKHRDMLREVIYEQTEAEKKRQEIIKKHTAELEEILSKSQQQNQKETATNKKRKSLEEQPNVIVSAAQEAPVKISNYKNPFGGTTQATKSSNPWASVNKTTNPWCSKPAIQDTTTEEKEESISNDEKEVKGFEFFDPLSSTEKNAKNIDADESSESNENEESSEGKSIKVDAEAIANVLKQKQLREKQVFQPFVEPRNNNVCLTGVTSINSKNSNFVEYQQRYSNVANVAGIGKKMVSTIDVNKTPTTVREGFMPSIDNNVIFSDRLDGRRTSRIKRDQKYMQFTNAKGANVRIISIDEAIDEYYEECAVRAGEKAKNKEVKEDEIRENDEETEIKDEKEFVDEIIDYPPFIATHEEKLWDEILPQLMELTNDEDRDEMIFKHIISKRLLIPFKRCLYCDYESNIEEQKSTGESAEELSSSSSLDDSFEDNAEEDSKNEKEKKERLHQKKLEKKIYKDLYKHMSLQHSFFIPAENYCIDPIGLVKQLQNDLSQGYCCLFCDHGFKSVSAAQNHMRSKGHTHIELAGNELLYADFYDYTASYPKEMLREIKQAADNDEEYEAMMKEVKALPFNFISAVERAKMRELKVSKYAGKMLSGGRGRVIAITEYRRVYQAVIPKWCINKYNQMLERKSAMRILALADKSGVDLNTLFLKHEKQPANDFKEEATTKKEEEISSAVEETSSLTNKHTELVKETTNAISTLLKKLKMTSIDVFNALINRKTQRELAPTNEVKTQSKAITENKKHESMNIDKPFFKRSTLHMYY